MMCAKEIVVCFDEMATKLKAMKIFQQAPRPLNIGKVYLNECQIYSK